jgi:hypothetical protein
MHTPLRLALVLVLLSSAVPTPATALVLCAKHNRKTGAITDGAPLKLRTTCKTSETQVDPGSIGLQSALGTGNVTVRLGDQITTNATVSTPANCSAGEVATGGGILATGNGGGVAAMRESIPQPDTAGATPTGWRSIVENTQATGTITATAYAVCVAP